MCWLELRYKMTHIKPGERAGFCRRPILLPCRSRSFANLFGCCAAVIKDLPRIASAIHRLINSAKVVTNRLAVEAGLSVLKAGGDFADGVIAYEGNWIGAEELVSFDSKAISVLQALGSRRRLLSQRLSVELPCQKRIHQRRIGLTL